MSTLETSWTGLKQGKGNIEGNSFDFPIAIPESFGGTGHGADPKDLLKASAAACLIMTLAILLESRSIKADDIHIISELTGTKPAELHIAHSVQISLTPDTTTDQQENARHLIFSAEKSCMIGNLLKAAGVKITVSGDISLTAL
ncbi:OsmC family protein [Enterobacteriaceae bacterium RIT814]|nr:OsmC family protein [Enterobacteriaceae bacterium RIT 814]